MAAGAPSSSRAVEAAQEADLRIVGGVAHAGADGVAAAQQDLDEVRAEVAARTRHGHHARARQRRHLGRAVTLET